jgi:putative molybdopterin biosynthesis protein
VASEERDLRPERAIRLDSIFTRSVVRALSLGFTLEQIEASFVTRLARFREDGENQSHLQSPPFSSLETPNVLRIMGSHDLALDLFASHFRRHSDTSLAVNHDGSIGGLMALAKGEAEIAGCHLLDEDSGEYNVPFVKRMLPGIPIAIVTLVGRDQGLIMPKGNPAGIQKLSDLTRPGLSLVRRQQGSGTRLLFEFLARTAGVDPASFNSQTPEAETHTAAAAAVAGGQADAALGIRAAARSFDLDFIPLWQERYDFVIPRRIWDSDAGAPLRETLASTEFQSAVLELSGYDTSRTGVVVALF